MRIARDQNDINPRSYLSAVEEEAGQIYDAVQDLGRLSFAAESRLRILVQDVALRLRGMEIDPLNQSPEELWGILGSIFKINRSLTQLEGASHKNIFESNLRYLVVTAQSCLRKLDRDIGTSFDELGHEVRTWLRANEIGRDEIREMLRYSKELDPRRLSERLPSDILFDMLAGISCGEDEGPPCKDMHHYVPAPIDLLLPAIDYLQPTVADTFTDIGGGLHRPSLLVALLTNAAVYSVEFQERLHRQACEIRDQLGLRNVEYVRGDATDPQQFDFGRSTIFFMHFPCYGAVMEAVADRLKGEWERRPITICTMGFDLNDYGGAGWINQSHETEGASIYRNFSPRS